MNRKTLVALLGICLIPSLLFGQFYRMDVDLQQAGQQRVIDRVFTGNTVGLDVGFWDGDSAFAVTNWSMFFKYTDGQYSTNDMDEIPGTTSSNRVVFDSTTNIFYSASENYYFSIFGIDGAGRRRTFARGRLIEEYDPAASTSLGVSTGGVYIVPWGGIYGDPASSTSLVSYVESLIGELGEPLWSAESNSVVSGIASNSAAVASVSGRVDVVEGWGDHGAAGYLHASATNALAVGGLSSTGIVAAAQVAIGSNTEISARIPSPLSPELGLLLSNKGLMVEADNRKNQYSPTTTNLPARSALAYDLRTRGRVALWLNSSGYQTGDGTYYDSSADIYFGQGTNLSDSTMMWSLCSRPKLFAATPTENYERHDTYGQLAIFEGGGHNNGFSASKRFSIFPGTNGVPGAIWMGSTSEYPKGPPDPLATAIIEDWYRHPLMQIIGSTNTWTSARPGIQMKAAGNNAKIEFMATNNSVSLSINGTNYVVASQTGGVWISSMANLSVTGTVSAKDFVVIPAAARVPWPENDAAKYVFENNGDGTATLVTNAVSVSGIYTNAIPTDWYDEQAEEDTVVTSIRSNAFRGMTLSVRYLQIPDSVTNIGERAFFGIPSNYLMEAPWFGTGLKEIGFYAFSGCSLNGAPATKEARTLRLPPSLERVMNGAFYANNGTYAVDCYATNLALFNNAFMDCIRLSNFYWRAGMPTTTNTTPFSGNTPVTQWAYVQNGWPIGLTNFLGKPIRVVASTNIHDAIQFSPTNRAAIWWDQNENEIAVDADVRALTLTATNLAATDLTVRDLTATGDLTTLGQQVKSRNATSAGDFGAAFGSSTAAGDYGFAAGSGTSAGNCGFATGVDTSAGSYGFAAGDHASAGNFGFAAGRMAKGADGSFVFADNSTGGAPFNRTNRPNEFAARAAGGVYFDTPMMVVTGTVTAGSFAFCDGNGRYFLNSSGTSWLTLDGTNLMMRATNGVTGRIQMIYE